ncbi:MAG TPA: hypothetical protein VLS89_18995, partial [Candidatus Nanopelagicales bacterium]|nr:hypothetical protein [Candidatus Nanopelagicales bacterium]
MRHTVAISDIHLCEQEPGEGFWMHWRRAAYAPDQDIAAMLDALRAEVRGADLELVLNGDVFDFDAPRFLQGRSLYHDFPRDAAHDAPALEAILDHHPGFVDALGRVLADGHTLVVVSGNHDAQLTLPEVRDVLRRRLVRAALATDPGLNGDALAARVVFRAWFHKTPDGIVLEHGNQYDPYCSFRYPMEPWGRTPGLIQPTLGSLAFRFMIARMGYFNPHVDETFMLTPMGYIAHWARYWLFSRRSLLAIWASGAARTLLRLVRSRDPGQKDRRHACLLAAARETGAPFPALVRHARLFARPVEDHPGLIARQLWLDRAALLLLALLLAAAWLLVVPAALAPAAVVAPAAFLTYELSTRRPPLGSSWRGIRGAARAIARAHRARAVIFGHTHNPEGTWEDGVFYGNTGSWSSAFADEACTKPLCSERPLIWLRS